MEDLWAAYFSSVRAAQLALCAFFTKLFGQTGRALSVLCCLSIYYLYLVISRLRLN